VESCVSPSTEYWYVNIVLIPTLDQKIHKKLPPTAAEKGSTSEAVTISNPNTFGNSTRTFYFSLSFISSCLVEPTVKETPTTPPEDPTRTVDLHTIVSFNDSRLAVTTKNGYSHTRPLFATFASQQTPTRTDLTTTPMIMGLPTTTMVMAPLNTPLPVDKPPALPMVTRRANKHCEMGPKLASEVAIRWPNASLDGWDAGAEGTLRYIVVERKGDTHIP
jgi:hypothetical protein